MTSKIVAEAALLLAARRDQLPTRHRPGAGGRGGVLTPAFALGTTLLDELTARGVLEVRHYSAGPVDRL